MASAVIATLIKMLENLPETTQNQILEHLRDYIAEVQDEIQWDLSFKNTQQQLIKAAQRAKKEIADGCAVPMDYNQL